MYGDSKVNARKIVNFLRTNWISDPYTRGGYSFYAAGGSNCDNNYNIDKLGEY